MGGIQCNCKSVYIYKGAEMGQATYNICATPNRLIFPFILKRQVT